MPFKRQLQLAPIVEFESTLKFGFDLLPHFIRWPFSCNLQHRQGLVGPLPYMLIPCAPPIYCPEI